MNRPVAGVGDGDSIQDWFKSIPLITKGFLVSTLLSGALLSFGMISPMDLVFVWPLVKNKFNVWRLFTSFIYAGPFSFNFAMHTYVLYENCKRYEANPFNTGAGGTSADFLWMLLVTMGILLVIAFYFDLMVLSEPILYVIMYVWSRREPDAQLNIFGFRFKSLYLPWVYVALRLIMGGAITEPLIGIAVGHLYYFLIEVLPVTHGYNLIRTPKFCVDFVGYVTGQTPLTAERATYTGVGRTLGTATRNGGEPRNEGLFARLGLRVPNAAAGQQQQPAAAPVGGGLRQRHNAAPTGSGSSGGSSTGTGYQWGSGRTLGNN